MLYWQRLKILQTWHGKAFNMMIAYDSIQEIEYFRLRALRGALKLEMIGMKRKGRSVYSILKEEFGFKGNKQKVLKQLEEKIKKHENIRNS